MRIVFLMLAIFSLQAEVLSYINEQGRTVYVDDASKIPVELSMRARRAGVDISKVTAPEYEPVEARVKVSDTPILLVTESCGYCAKAEEYLKANKIKFTKLDVMDSYDGAKLYSELGGNGVPILKAGSNVIRGFSPSEYAMLIKR